MLRYVPFWHGIAWHRMVSGPWCFISLCIQAALLYAQEHLLPTRRQPCFCIASAGGVVCYRLLSFVGPWPEEHNCAMSQNMESFNWALWAKIGRYSPRCSTHLQRGSQTLETAKRSEPQGRRHFWWGSQTEPSTWVNSNDEWRMKIRKAWEIKETWLQVWQVW